jgi:4-hydroxythreonine-4-phosphate dehydrogenase
MQILHALSSRLRIRNFRKRSNRSCSIYGLCVAVRACGGALALRDNAAMSDAAIDPPADAASFAALALTMGDPCGIGPEIVCKALSGRPAAAQPQVIGHAARLAQAAARCGVAPPARICEIGPDVGALPWGRVQPLAGEAAFRYVEHAAALALRGEVQGIVTAPLHKAALHAAGHRWPGHTEMLRDLAGAPRVAMMLANDELRVVLVTIHCALREAIGRVTHDSELAAIALAQQAGRALGIGRPRIAVAGLNPHAGEDGLFGDEEQRIIAPAVAAARAQGIDASGPWPGDTVFMRARRGEFDVVVAQYHDQGLIPVKYLGVDHGVNITLGLPFVRTSPDHGTAFDIAGRGTASDASLRCALRYAARLCAAEAAAPSPR